MTNEQPKSPIFGNLWYDRVKFLVQVILPGLATLYFTIAEIWDLPKAAEVSATITGLAVFLGLLLQVSSSRFAKGGGVYDGEIVIQDTSRGPVYTMAFENREDQKAVNDKAVLVLKQAPSS